MLHIKGLWSKHNYCTCNFIFVTFGQLHMDHTWKMKVMIMVVHQVDDLDLSIKHFHIDRWCAELAYLAWPFGEYNNNYSVWTLKWMKKKIVSLLPMLTWCIICGEAVLIFNLRSAMGERQFFMTIWYLYMVFYCKDLSWGIFTPIMKMIFYCIEDVFIDNII